MRNWRSVLAEDIVWPAQTLWSGSTERSYLRELERSQFLPPRGLREVQFDRLRELLIHAYENCPFYRERFRDCDFHPRDFHEMEDLQRLPLLTKKDIQQHRERMKARNFPDSALIPNKTGGSTGSPLHFYMDQHRRDSRQAATFRHNAWAGWRFGMRTAYLWGHRGDLAGAARWKMKIRNFLLERAVALDTSSMTREKLDDFRRQLRRVRPPLYIGYANSLYLYAQFLKESGTSDYHRPRSIITSAEFLAPEQRQLIETVLEAPIFDRYGSRETSVIASECDRHKGLHICAETLYLETVRDGRPAPFGELGKIIITDLLNYGMPLIRYQIEDAGILSDERCPCGRGLPLLQMAAGRVTDFLITPEGKIVSGAALTIYLIANAPGIAQAQIVQEKRDQVIFRIVKGEQFGRATEKFLSEEIPKFLGADTKFAFEYVPDIPKESSGKYRFSISKVDPAEVFH